MAIDEHGWPTNTGGVKPIPIAGETVNIRKRLGGMTPVERAWRKQWLKDQELAHDEPRIVPELRKELVNPLRRFYQRPLDLLREKLVPIVGEAPALVIRMVIPKLFFTLVGIYSFAYVTKYNQTDWTRENGVLIKVSRRASIPGDTDFPRPPEKVEKTDYNDEGFKARKVFLD